MEFSENKGDRKGKRSDKTSSNRAGGNKFSKRKDDSGKFQAGSKRDSSKKFPSNERSDGKPPKSDGKAFRSEGSSFKSEGKPFKSGGKPFKSKFKSDSEGKEKPAGRLKSRINYKKKKTTERPDDGKIRLNRFIANAGICSRREADRMIELGEIKVNGEVVTELGTKIDPSDTVHYGGERVRGEKKQYVLLNKPKNYITTSDDPRKRKTVMDLVGNACKERIYPVGRLDRQSTGVLLLTNDGELTKKLTHPSSKVAKTYHVIADKSVTKAHLVQLVEGIELEDGVVVSADKAVYVEGASKKELGIELHSGKNRVIRKMMEALGYQVTKLDRVIFAGLTKKNLERGKWRFLTEKEVAFLKQLPGKRD